MTRWLALAFLSLAGLTVWLAGPASAGAFVGCTGNTCSVSLSTLITLKGDVGNGAAHVQLPVAPPPCLWQPIGNTTVGSTTIVQQFGSAAPGTPFGVYQSVRQARTLLKDKPVAGRHLVAAAGQPGRPEGGAEAVLHPAAVRLHHAGPGPARPAGPAADPGRLRL